MRAKRDYAMLAMLWVAALLNWTKVRLFFGRHSNAQGALGDGPAQVGRRRVTRTVPDSRVGAKPLSTSGHAQPTLPEGKIFRAVARMGKVWGRWGSHRTLCGTW